MNPSPPAARGPSPLFLQLLPALLLGCFATVLFIWKPFGKDPEHAYFEALLRPSAAGEALFLANIDGTGMPKEKIAVQPLRPGGVNHARFEMPAGRLVAFDFTPLNGPGEVDIVRCWLTSESGEMVAMISPETLAGSYPGAQRLEGGIVRVPGRVGNSVPVLKYNPQPAIDLALNPLPPLWQLAAVFFVTWIITFVVARFAPTVPWRSVTSPLARFGRKHPGRALLAAALFSTVVSCFPVVFCGKSFVSPDNGMQLLYEGTPAVLGAQGGKVENPVGSDMGAMLYWHMPASMIQHRAIFEDGEFPLWNRYNWGGVSLWAQCISMLGDPLHWPAVLTGGASWAWDSKFVAYKVLFAFGIGLLVWASARSLPAALLLALSAPWMGFFAYRFCHAGFFALCAAPWILLAWLEAARAPNLRRVTLWGFGLIFANWMQLNSGTAKESSAFLVFLNAAGALALLGAALPWRERWKRIGIFAWANVLFVLLSAPLWMTFLDALGKAATFYAPPQICQIQPGLLIGAFDDIFYRQFMPAEFVLNPSANFFVLLGAAWALVRGRVLAKDGTFVATLIVATAAAAIAFGVVSPHLLAQVPMIKAIYHFDNTFSCVLFILLFVLAGYGLRECHRRMPSPEWRGDWLIVLAMVGVLMGAFFGLTQAAHRAGTTFLLIGQTIPKSDFFYRYGTALVLALAISPWAWREVRLRRAGALGWLLVAVCAFATLHFRHGMYLETRFDDYTMNPKKRLDLRALPSPAVAQIKQAMQEPARVIGIDGVMLPGFNTVLGLETVSGPDALQNPAMRDLAKTLGIPQLWFWRLMAWHQNFPAAQRAFDMLGVRYYLGSPGSAAGLRGMKLLGSSDLDVFESETAWPRAFFTDTVATYRELPEIRRLVEQGDGRPFAAMMPLARSRIPLPERDLAKRTIVPAHDYRLTQNTTAFVIEAPAPGLAVLGEAWLPGDLEVTVDGRPAEVLRVDHAFRGVFLEAPGRHTVQFRYWPEILGPALWLAVTGALALLATIWLTWRRPAAVAERSPGVEQEVLPERV